MNKFFKKLAVLLSFVMVFTAMPMSVFAEEATTPVEVGTYEELLTALETANANVVMTQDITGAAAANSGYGVAGIVLEAGDVLDGNGHKLTVNGANTTWDCAVAMRGGEVKNLTIAGAMRGVFMPGANGNVVIDGCVFENVIYTFSSDAGSKDYSVTIKNTTLNGWTSFSDVHKSVTFENCNFGEGSGYAYCRPYQATTFTNCNFAEGFAVDTRTTEANALVFNGCKYNNVALSAENNDMFIYGGSVVIDNNTTDVNHYVAKVGENPFMTLQEAVNAANGGTVTMLENVEVTSMSTFTTSATLDLAGHTITATDCNAIQIINGTLTVKDSVGNGKIVAAGNQGIRVGENGVAAKAGNLILESGTVEGEWGVTVWADSSVTVNGGTINGTSMGISGNGNVGEKGNGGTTVTINGGSINAVTGVYHPQAGTITVNGGTITGTASGVEMRSGNLTVNAGTITGGNTYTVPASNGNGTTTAGVAVAVAPHTTNQASSVTIKGGTLTAAKSFAEVNPESGEVVPAVAISGGTHNGEVETTETSGVITGGTFSVKPENTCVATGYEAVEKDGVYVVGEHKVEAVEGIEAKCEATGTKAYYTCKFCGTLYSDAEGKNVVAAESLVIPATGHAFGEWVVDEAAGVKTRTCKNGCGETETAKLPVTEEAEKLPNNVQTEVKLPDVVEEDTPVEVETVVQVSKDEETKEEATEALETTAATVVSTIVEATNTSKTTEEVVKELKLEEDTDAANTPEEFVKFVQDNATNEEGGVLLTITKEPVVEKMENVPEADKEKITVAEGAAVEYLDIKVKITATATGKSVTALVSELNKPMPITFAYPADWNEGVKEGMVRKFILKFVHDGVAGEVEAVDNGNNTVTAYVDQFSTYALTYVDVPATHNHTWGYNTTFDAAAHWDYCHVCGAQNTPVAHSDADGNGFCDCGWNFAATANRANPNTGVTADMLK